MSTIYIGERQSGKTTMLIEMSEKTGATIVVATYSMAKYIQLLAAQMGKKIPVSIKFCDEENAALCALVKHNEALRKGEVNAEN